MPQLRDLRTYAEPNTHSGWAGLNHWYTPVDFKSLGLGDESLTSRLDDVSEVVRCNVMEHFHESKDKLLHFTLSTQDAEVLRSLKHRAEVILNDEKVGKMLAEVI